MIWAFLNFRFKQYAPYVVLLLPTIFGIIINLQIRRLLPYWLQDDTFRHGEEMTLIVLVMSLLMNYNSFLVSVIFFPIVFILAYEALIEVRVERYYDPLTGESLTAEQTYQY